MRIFTSHMSSTRVIRIRASVIPFGLTGDDIDGPLYKTARNADKAYVLQALSDLFDFDANESSSWSPAEGNAVDEAFAFIDFAYSYSDVGALGRSQALTMANLNTGRSLALVIDPCPPSPTRVTQDLIDPASADWEVIPFSFINLNDIAAVMCLETLADWVSRLDSSDFERSDVMESFNRIQALGQEIRNKRLVR
jgi:hypothetical protein